jgi:hypothetical protein
MTMLTEVQTALAGGARLFSSVLAGRAGLTVKTFNKRISALYRAGYISREKVAGAAGPAYFRYFMTDEQCRAFQYRVALERMRIDRLAAPPEILELPVSAVDAVSRLTFLKMIRDRTIFGEHAALTAIIDDYESTLRMRAENEADPLYFQKAAGRVKASKERRAER